MIILLIILGHGAWGRTKGEGGKGKGERENISSLKVLYPLPFTVFSSSNPQSLVFIP